MDALAVVARLMLAAVFGVSGIAKLLDRDGTRRGVEGFGLPQTFVDPVAAGLPLAECAVAVALVPGTTARAGSFAALGLLAAFMVGISVNLANGRRPDCHCFGQLHSAPVGPSTLARNAALAAAAGIVAFGAGSDAGGSALDAIGDLDATGAILVAAAVLGICGGIVVLGRRSKGLLTGTSSSSEAPPGPELGSQAPGFALPSSAGGTMALSDLLARGNRVLLVFFSPSCGPCKRIAPELARWQRELPGRLTVAVLSAGAAETVSATAAEYQIGEMLIDEGGAVAKSYGSRGTPGAVLIDPSGSVASHYAAGEGPIGDLLLDAFGLTDIVGAVAAEKDAEPDPASGDVVEPDSIDLTFVPVARGNVTMGERDGETVLVDRASGAVHLLNPTAAIVWQCLDGTGTIQEIVNDIADVFEREHAEVTDAVVEVVRRFGRQGLLQGVGLSTESTPAQPAT